MRLAKRWGNSLAYGSSPAGDSGSSSAPESRSVSPQALSKAMNGGLSGSQLMGGDTDWDSRKLPHYSL
jgi:hypothetical protein